MKTKKMSGIIWLVLCMALITICGGCRDKEVEEPLNLAIVSGYHANSPVPAFRSQAVKTALDTATKTCGSITVVVNDGDPYVAGSFIINPPTKKISDSKQAAINHQYVLEFQNLLSQKKAQAPEANLLNAIGLAVRGLPGSGNGGNQRLLILDNGLQTEGYLPMQNNLLRADIEEVLAYLSNMQALPDLSGINVEWIGLGDVAPPQTELTPSALADLLYRWRSILIAAGAESVVFFDELPANEVDMTLPDVTTVPIVQDLPLEATITDLNTPLIFDENKLLFKADSTELADLEQAKQVLEPLISYLELHKEERILIAGTTATVGDNQTCKAFSLGRAKAIRDMMENYGVNREAIQTIGLGYDHAYHIPDVDDNGNLIHANAKANRCVIIMKLDTVEAQLLVGS